MQTLLFKGQLFNFNSLVLILLCSGFGSFLLFISPPSLSVCNNLSFRQVSILFCKHFVYLDTVGFFS